MQPLLNLTSAQNLDHSLIEKYALSEKCLIDNAAMGVFKLSKPFIHGRTLVMVGPGNNGSDGIALASILAEEGFDTSVFYLYGRGNDENMRRRRELPESVRIVSSTHGFDTVFDALFGFSFRGEADDATRTAVSGCCDAGTVIAVDVPSASLVRADYTVSLMALKSILYEPLLRMNAGRILLFNPGFPENELSSSPDDIYLITDQDAALPHFASTDYKNRRGHVAVLGGSDEYTGAPRLAARSAFFSGAGLVTILTDSERIRDENPAVIIRRPGSDLSFCDAIVAGPGWGNGSESLFRKAAESGKPMVVDADALKFMKGMRLGHRAVLTPHIGEYKRLMASLSIPDGLGNAEALSSSLRALADKTESVVVLKSSVIWITDGESILVYDGSNPSLGVAGSGDVLAGVIGALLAEGMSTFDAAVAGTALHQRAGRRAHDDYGYYSAEELILEVGKCR